VGDFEIITKHTDFVNKVSNIQIEAMGF